jgi:mRNA-degrading endonuclease toxin of MazEF toxin-antitoxin module
MPILRGQIYFIDFGPLRHDFGPHPERPVKELAFSHPAVVLSINDLNAVAQRSQILVTVVPGTSAERVERDFKTDVRVPARASQLPKDTVFRAFQVTALDSRRFSNQPAGFLTGKYLERVEDAVRYVLGLGPAGPRNK